MYTFVYTLNTNLMDMEIVFIDALNAISYVD